jgi:hypothetical protein
MAAAGKGHRHWVMVTAKSGPSLESENKAAMPMSVYVRAKALEAARPAEPWRRLSGRPFCFANCDMVTVRAGIVLNFDNSTDWRPDF